MDLPSCLLRTRTSGLSASLSSVTSGCSYPASLSSSLSTESSTPSSHGYHSADTPSTAFLDFLSEKRANRVDVPSCRPQRRHRLSSLSFPRRTRTSPVEHEDLPPITEKLSLRNRAGFFRSMCSLDHHRTHETSSHCNDSHCDLRRACSQDGCLDQDPGRTFTHKLSGYLSQILESENKEKEKSVRQLEGALKMQEKTMQVRIKVCQV